MKGQTPNITSLIGASFQWGCTDLLSTERQIRKERKVICPWTGRSHHFVFPLGAGLGASGCYHTFDFAGGRMRPVTPLRHCAMTQPGLSMVWCWTTTTAPRVWWRRRIAPTDRPISAPALRRRSAMTSSHSPPVRTELLLILVIIALIWYVHFDGDENWMTLLQGI